jgi:hypothetical protein
MKLSVQQTVRQLVTVNCDEAQCPTDCPAAGYGELL